VAFLDLDRFKAVNDGWGHDAGDRVLSDVAAHLRNGVRRQDSVIRWGGEEFVLLLPMTDKDAARLLLDRLCSDGVGRRPDGTRQTVSVGIADLEQDKVTSWAELVTLADRRMYMAKEAGRNRIVADDTAATPPVQAALSN
jgi:diguanylate cyclase (GGDEF)-like protein